MRRHRSPDLEEQIEEIHLSPFDGNGNDTGIDNDHDNDNPERMMESLSNTIIVENPDQRERRLTGIVFAVVFVVVFTSFAYFSTRGGLDTMGDADYMKAYASVLGQSQSLPGTGIEIGSLPSAAVISSATPVPPQFQEIVAAPDQEVNQETALGANPVIPPQQTDGTVADATENQSIPQQPPQQGGIPSPPDPNQLIVMPELLGFKDTWDAPQLSTDTPVFWHVGKSGGTTVKDMMGGCFHKTLASDFATKNAVDLNELKVYNDRNNVEYVNVDITTREGIQGARQMNFGQSHLAEIVFTPLVFEAESLFADGESRGRVFALFRNPIERAVSMFHYIQHADWEPTYTPELKQMSMEEYAKSSYIENNFMTRYLVNDMEGTLDLNHLKIAMDIIRRKVLVGLLDQLDFSLSRFEKFFEWKYAHNPTEQEACRESLLTLGTNQSLEKTILPEKGSAVYILLLRQNLLDMQLYNYVLQLFELQEKFVTGKPENFRLVDATCGACGE